MIRLFIFAIFALVRFFFFLLTRRWGLITVGSLLILFGLGYSLGSHQVTYQKAGLGTVAHHLASKDSGGGYLQMDNNPSMLYYLNESDFSPTIKFDTFGRGDTISFIYNPDDSQAIDVTSELGTHLQGTAYKVVEITLLTNGSQQEFTTAEFSQAPNGYYQNNWAGGVSSLVIGLLTAGLAFAWPMLRGKNKQQGSFGVAPSAAMGVPQQANMYQQPYAGQYQNPGQYQQYPQQLYQNPGQNPQYPQQPYQQNPGQYSQYPQQQPGQYPPQSGSYEPTQRANP